MLERGIAVAFLSVCLAVCLSVCQTRALWQNEIIVCQCINTIRQSDVFSFLGAKFRGPQFKRSPRTDVQRKRKPHIFDNRKRKKIIAWKRRNILLRKRILAQNIKCQVRGRWAITQPLAFLNDGLRFNVRIHDIILCVFDVVAVVLCYFTEFDMLWGVNYVNVVKDKPILSATEM